MNNELKRLRRIIGTLIVAFALSFAGVSGAMAVSFGGETGGGGGGQHNSGGQPPVNTVPPVSQGGSVAKPRNDNTYWEYYFVDVSSTCGEDSIGRAIQWKRTFDHGTVKNGKAIPPNEISDWKYIKSKGDRSYWYLDIGTDAWGKCLYKPQFKVIPYKHLCVDTSKVSISMTQPAPKDRLLTKSFTTPWGNGNKTINGCGASRSGSVGAGIVPKEYGQYYTTGDTTVDILYIKRYETRLDGTKQPDEVHGWERAADQGHFEKYGTLNCSGWHEGLRPWKTDGACSNQNSNNPNFICAMGNNPSVDGRFKESSSELMKSTRGGVIQFKNDGVPRRIDFTGGKGKPTLKGASVGNIHHVQSKLEYRNLPWSPRLANWKNVTELHQGYRNMVDGSSGEKSIGGLHWNDYTLELRQASTRANAVITPSWKFSATFTTKSIVIESINPMTGSWVTSPTTITTKGTAECVGNPLKFEVVRAIGDTANVNQ